MKLIVTWTLTNELDNASTITDVNQLNGQISRALNIVYDSWDNFFIYDRQDSYYQYWIDDYGYPKYHTETTLNDSTLQVTHQFILKFDIFEEDMVDEYGEIDYSTDTYEYMDELNAEYQDDVYDDGTEFADMFKNKLNQHLNDLLLKEGYTSTINQTSEINVKTEF